MEEKDLLIRAMNEAGYHYDSLESYEGYHRFLGGHGNVMSMGSFEEVEEWLRGVVFDDAFISNKVDAILSEIDELREPKVRESKNKYALSNVRIKLVVSEEDTLFSNVEMSGPNEAIPVLRSLLSKVDREYVCVVNLDNKNRPINYNIVSIGDISSAIVPIQNVFKSAILSNSSGIMLAHSHPSGDITPSKEDLMLTERIIQAGKLMNIPVVDHIIVGGKTARYYSFRENNYGLFQEPMNKEKIDSIIKQKREKSECKKVAESKSRVNKSR